MCIRDRINALPKEEEPEKQQPEQPAPAEEQVPAEEGGMHLEPSLFTDRAAPDPESVQEPTLEFKEMCIRDRFTTG